MYRIHDTEKRVRIRERLQEEEEEGSEISGKPFTYALRVLRKLIFLIALFSRLCALSAILGKRERYSNEIPFEALIRACVRAKRVSTLLSFAQQGCFESNKKEG